MDKPTATEQTWSPPPALLTNGKDEMNLAEFPIASLRSRGDARDAIVHEGYVVDKQGNRHHQRWVVTGDSVAGLPTEFDERVYVALMALSALGGFASRRVPFSIYHILKQLGLQDTKRSYGFVEHALDRLKGATIKTKGAFYDRERGELVHTAMAFNIIDKYWLRYRETDERIREEEGVPAYVVWGEDIWNSFRAGYIKNLDLAYFYSLQSPTARRLFRFLDKRMHYKDTYEIDVYELASRLGMIRYQYASRVRRKLQPAIEELTATGFLAEASFPDHKGYTRARFVRAQRQTQPETRTSPVLPESGNAVDRLVVYGISRKKAEDLAKEHSQEYLQAKIEFLEWRLTASQRGRPITDPAGWLIRAIKDDYQPPKSYQPPQEREQRAATLELAWQRINEQREQKERKHDALRGEALARLESSYGTGERERSIWAQAQAQLSAQMLASTYKAWIAPLHLLSLREGTATLAAPNQAVREWVERRLADHLKSHLGDLVGQSVNLAFEVVSGNNATDRGVDITT